MSEPNESRQALVFGVESGAVAGSPGKLLRAAREAAGLDIGALAGSLKIPVSKLEALESDNFSELPDAVFARALAASVCRALGVDPAFILELMPKNEASVFSVASNNINASFKDGSQKLRKNSFLEYSTRPVGAAIIILLLGVIALLFVPFDGEFPAISEKSKKSNLHMAEQEAALSPSELVKSKPIVASESVAEEVPVPIAAASIPVEPEPTRTSPETIAHHNSGNLLEFRALGDSWVQVKDATKAVVFERILTKGETVSAIGTLPLTVVIGRADVTEVLVRGKPLELAGLSKDNVARFEVKE